MEVQRDVSGVNPPPAKSDPPPPRVKATGGVVPPPVSRPPAPPPPPAGRFATAGHGDHPRLLTVEDIEGAVRRVLDERDRELASLRKANATQAQSIAGQGRRVAEMQATRDQAWHERAKALADCHRLREQVANLETERAELLDLLTKAGYPATAAPTIVAAVRLLLDDHAVLRELLQGRDQEARDAFRRAQQDRDQALARLKLCKVGVRLVADDLDQRGQDIAGDFGVALRGAAATLRQIMAGDGTGAESIYLAPGWWDRLGADAASSGPMSVQVSDQATAVVRGQVVAAAGEAVAFDPDSISAAQAALAGTGTSIADLLADHEARIAYDPHPDIYQPTPDELHARCAHPDYEYAMTTCGRKQGPAPEPDGDGWEPNTFGGDPHSSWERFDYHEEHWWRRRCRAIDELPDDLRVITRPDQAFPLPVALDSPQQTDKTGDTR